MASTPKSATPIKKAALAADSPGGWRHPRLAEIERRRAAATFSETNVRTIVTNVCALVAVWAANTALGSWGPMLEYGLPTFLPDPVEQAAPPRPPVKLTERWQ